jgi:hypothetical protein
MIQGSTYIIGCTLGTVTIERKVDDKSSIKTLSMSPSEFFARYTIYRAGDPIEIAFDNLSTDDQIFLVNGLVPYISKVQEFSYIESEALFV